MTRGSRRRYDNLAEVRSLDPYDDADRDRIVTLTARHDLPWDFDQGVAIAFLRDYGIPSIARLLDRAFGMGLPEVYAVVRPGNDASMSVCRRLGMAPLGRLRRWYDVELEAFRLMAPVVVE